MNKEEKREVIMKHYQNPINRRENNSDSYIKVNSNNESCIDNINVYILFEDNVIKDITFDGEACAISISSTSIMINNLIGKTISEAKKYINNFENMLDGKNYDKDILNEAIVYDEISKQGARKVCALLPYNALKKAIKELESK